MKIIISPAKKMQVDNDILEVRELPVFLEKAEFLMNYLRSLSYEEAKKLWNCNELIATLNYERLKSMDLRRNLTPALLAYQGIQYQYMAPAVLEDGQWEYVQNHVCILSGFYGMVRPLDGVVPYRLEMQAKVKLPDVKDLYEYWGDLLYKEMTRETDIILNLASKEYSKCIEKYVSDKVQFVTCVFGEYNEDHKIIEKGTYAKMARGEMVRYMAEHQIEDLEEIKKYDRLGYRYAQDASDEKKIVFVKKDK